MGSDKFFNKFKLAWETTLKMSENVSTNKS